jgi:hypothetical protein
MSRSRRQPPLFEVMSGQQRQQLSPSATPPALRKPEPPTLPRLAGSTGVPPAPAKPVAVSHGVVQRPPAEPVRPEPKPVAPTPELRLSTAASESDQPPPADGSIGADMKSVFGGRVPAIAFGIVGLIIAGCALWVIAYRKGVADEQRNLIAYTSGGDPAARPAADPLAQPRPVGTPSVPQSRLLAPGQPQSPSQTPSPTPGLGARPSGSVPPAQPTTAQAPPAGTSNADGTPEKIEPKALDVDPRKPGFNYLEIVRLTWNDAEEAVNFLRANKVNAVAVPVRKVDPAEARAKNLPHLVLVADGVPSDRFRVTAAERAALVERIRALGQKFQREERGASDFAEPGWARFKDE